jgi:response regulator RpfG family c-di-GMP phosphodiesterase
VDRAVAEIENLSDRQFDPEVVEAFSTLDHVELITGFEHRRAPAAVPLAAA